MQSDQPPSDFSRMKDPRLTATQGHRTGDKVKRKQSEDFNAARLKRKSDGEGGDDSSDVEYYNFEKLKKFHIPRKKEHSEKELLTKLPLDAREYTRTIHPTFRSSYFDTQSGRKLAINQVELVQNHKLEKEYLTKKKDLKDEGRLEKDLTDFFGYVHFFKRSEVEKVCKDGLTVGHCNLASLGKPSMGVYVCKHADIVRFSKWEKKQSGYIVMFKIMKGKTKLVTEGRTPHTEQEPTPLFDCHITKIPIDVAQSTHSRAYSAFQYYFYEYGDVDVVHRPRQVLPYAVLQYTYEDAPTSVIPGSRTSRRESSLDDVFPDIVGYTSFSVGSPSDGGFCQWRGKLLVKNGTFCSVELRSHLDTVFNVANIDRSVNVKTCLTLDKLKRQLPPTLLSRSAKKHNVIYRGRTFNTFTLHPTEEGSGLGKFRQLVSHLVQRSTAAFVPLRNNSSLYLLPFSGLTEEMGLQNLLSGLPTSNGEKVDRKAGKNFLHVITITPKALSSKINDQRVFNIIHNRKRKDSSSTIIIHSSVRDSLEQKLRMMNIDSSSALAAMEPEHHQKIYDRLKDKKKLLTSEKMLHSHYKDTDVLPLKAKAIYIKSTATRWTVFADLQQELYSGKKIVKAPQSSSDKRSRSISRNSTETVDIVAAMEDTAEAVFSDDECTSKSSLVGQKNLKKPKMADPAKVPDQSVRSRRISADPRVERSKNSHLLAEYTPSPITAAAVSPLLNRPSFKPLEDLLCSGNLEELLKHPDFSFSEKHSATHQVLGFTQPFGVDTPYVPWDEDRPHISVAFSQIPPYPLEGADCPYALDDDPVVLSMLRAIHGNYDGSDDTIEGRDKVQWVRRILHNCDSSAAKGDSDMSEPGQPARKIVEHIADKPSPQIPEASPHQSSTDSGFVSSASAGNTEKIDDSSLKDIAAIIASALAQQTKAIVVDAVLKETASLPMFDKSSERQKANSDDKFEGIDMEMESKFDGIDMEMGSTPEESPVNERTLLKDRHSPAVTPLHSQSATLPPIAGASTQHPQGTNGTDPSPRLPLHPPLHPSGKVLIPRETETLAVLRRIIPGLTKEKLGRLMARVAPVVTKMLSKMKSGSKNKTDGVKMGLPANRPFITTARATRGKTGVTRPCLGSTICPTEAERMTVTLIGGRRIASATAGAAKALKEMTGMPSQDITAANQPRKETCTKSLIGDTPLTGIGQRGTAVNQNRIEDDGSLMIAIQSGSGRMSTMKNPLLLCKEGILSSTTPADLASETCLPTSTEKTSPTQKNFMTEGLTPIVPPNAATPIDMTKTPSTNPSWADRGILTQGIPEWPSPGPYYPILPPGPYFDPAHAPSYPMRGYVPVGGSIPRYLPYLYNNAISAQNTELLHTILSLLRPQRDPRLKQALPGPSRCPGPNQHTGIVPGATPPSVTSPPCMADQANAILQQLLTTPSAPAPKPGWPEVSPPKPSSPKLSQDEVQRIREKMEKNNAQKRAERELCRREAMYMRAELNKSIERSKNRLLGKRSKNRKSRKHKLSRSPGHSKSIIAKSKSRHHLVKSAKRKKIKLDVTEPVSEKIVEDSALDAPEETSDTPLAVNNSTMLTRPTGVVTPSPRPVHPIFMQSRYSFPLTETSSASTSVNTSPSISGSTQVLSEIDTTLSQLKQGMQDEEKSSELKDSMAKLLQLVLKLGSAGSLESAPPSESDIKCNAANEDAVTSRPSSVSDTDPQKTGAKLSQSTTVSDPSSIACLPHTATVPSSITCLHSTATVTDPPSTTSSHSIVNAVEEKTSAFSWSLEHIADDQLPVPGASNLFSSTGLEDLSSEIAVERHKTITEFKACSTVTETSTTKLPCSRIDEILDQLRPHIKTMLQRDGTQLQRNEETIQNATTSQEDSTDSQPTEPEKIVESLLQPESLDVPSPVQPLSRSHVLNPATEQHRPIPAIELAKISTVHTTSFQAAGWSSASNRDAEFRLGQVIGTLSSGASDRSTPTLDERYPDPIRQRKRKKVASSPTNSFVVFDPERAIECEVISRFLVSAKGTKVDILKLAEELASRVSGHGSDLGVFEKEFQKILPPGILWVVLRSVDVKAIHSMSHLALLKAAGPRVQFVSADNVQEVRERKYKSLLSGDAGVLVPLCPKTLLAKPATFQHLMLWLLGQSGGKVKHKWRIAFHQHVLNAVQDAEDSDDALERRNADQVLQWLCHTGKSKGRLAIDLDKHRCDRVDAICGKKPNVWNWYDTATDEELAAFVLPCAVKLQSDRVRQSRHVVLLIDGDPGALCWQPVWRSGACVTTVERFVEVVCSKPYGSATQQSTSCISALCGPALLCS